MNNVIKGIKLIISGLLTPFKTIINNYKEFKYIGQRVLHIEDSLMYDATPDELNKRITTLNDIHSHRIDTIIQEIDFINNELAHFKDRDKVLSDRINNQLSLIRDIEEKLESTDVPVDLGEFNFINTADETDELLQIEAEMLGSSVAQEEYDWHCEQKAKNKQIQDKMRADEAEYDRLSEPDKDNGIW